jgi:POT family proton-dependent oligopeptide transporter
MATATATAEGINAHDAAKHPKGLYVLFATEMWERFSFYSMLAMFTLYLQDPNEGFGWTAERATGLYANYLMFVYASPLVGGWIADKKLGYRRAVMIGGLFFMAGHLLLSFRSLPVVYAALTCLVIGNGFFKPNVSTMVGNLYPEGSHLKDRAYNIFYMGINVGAFIAPIVAEFMHDKFGFHPAFALAAGGMLISVLILAFFKKHIEGDERGTSPLRSATQAADAAATAVDAPPHGVSRQDELEAVPERKRIFALLVIFLIVIVFWMCFHQNGSTFTYFADKNTDWNVRGIISNSINPFWIITLTFPLVWFWKWLDRKGLEPSTPVKMAFGMVLVAGAFYVLAAAGKAGGDTGKVSPAWIVGAYFVISLGELLISPMGLALVSKVAPRRMRGLMMGGWFVATAIGNKLTMIGVYWDYWLHSNFFALLGTMALATALILFLLIKPLKKAMPGV